MALLSWGEEDENKKSFLDPNPIKHIQSVQSTWQPTQSVPTLSQAQSSTGAQSDNYLLSQEKEQVDQQLREKREAEERARQAAEAARVAVEVQKAREAELQKAREANAQIKATPKYSGSSEQKKDEGFWGFLKDVGAGIQQSVVRIGDVIGQGGALVNYLNPFDGKTQEQKLADIARYDASRRAFLDKNKDISGNSFVGTRDVEDAATRINNGTASIRDFLTLAGNSLQIGIDATMFLPPVGMALSSVPAATVKTANILARTAANPAVRYAARDAAFFGTLQGTATFQRIYGETGDIEKATEAALRDALIGATLQGGLDLAGQGVNVAANRTLNSLRRPNRFKIGDEAVELVEETGEKFTPTTQAERNQSDIEGQPTQDGNISFVGRTDEPTLGDDLPQNLTPVVEPVGTPELPQQVSPVDEVELQPVRAPQTPEAPQQTPIDAVELETPRAPEAQPVDAPQVAEGVPAPRPVPVVDPNTPTVKSEELQLQEARAGTTQAEEAAINQRLQELESQTPRIDDESTVKPPTRVYHGSNVELEGGKPKPGRTAYKNGGRTTTSEMSFFSDNKDVADFFAKDRTKHLGGKESVTEYDLDESDILDWSNLKDNADLWQEFFKLGYKGLHELEAPKGDFTSLLDTKRFKESLQKAGYKGVKFKEKDGITYGIIDDSVYTPVSKKPRTADDELSDLDARLERGEIDFDEHARLEDEIFARESAEGRMIAEDGQGNLPDDMQPSTSKKKIPKKLTPVQAMDDVFAERFVSMPAKENSMQSKLASSVGLTKDGDSAVADILRDGGVTGKKAERIIKLFDEVDKIIENKRKIQRSYRNAIKRGEDIDTDPAKIRNRLTRKEADIVAKLQAEINSLSIKGKKGERLVHNLETFIQAKNINQLFGAPIERSITADVLGTALYTAKNPVAMARSITKHGNPASSAWGSTKRGWKTPPKTVAEGYKYLIGNAYRTAMTPAQIAADMRKGAFRTELTKWANKELRGKELSNAEAEKLSRIAGDDMEALVNMGAGVDNGTVNIFRYWKALKYYKDFIRNGSEASYRKFLETVDRQNQLADAIARGVSNEKIGRPLAALVNGLLPYMRNAVNMTVKGVAYDLNPFTLSLIDGIRADQRGWAANLVLGIKNKTVDYAVLAALGSTLVYNPSDDVDDQGVPPGVSIHLGGDNYFSLRGTPLEFPLAAIQMTKEIVADTISGKVREPQYYLNMIKNSIPYVDYMDSHGNVLKSALGGDSEDGDNGYAAKNFVVSQAKSLVPFSNNNIQASLSRFDLDGDGNRSMNAKKVYDKDMGKWFVNTLKNAYNIDRDSLPDSRDAAGRVRTVNNQGAWMNKSISDKDTAKYNSVITDLVKYARDEGIGTGTQDMFNTFDDGANNHFSNINSTIWAVTGKGGNETKLKSNPMLADLSRQIRDGFFGEGDDLLMIGDQNLYAKIGMPNSRDSKNSSKPINMKAIRQAIAAADLSEEQQNRMDELSRQASSLYNRAKSGEISWEQQQQAMAEIAAEERDILANSASYRRMNEFMLKLDSEGFFDEGGLGSTRSGQTFLWNAFSKMLGAKGKTPAADFPKTRSGFGGGGGGGRRTRASVKPGDRGSQSIKWQPVGRRQMANVGKAKYTPFKVKVTLGNAVKRDRSQNYTDRNF